MSGDLVTVAPGLFTTVQDLGRPGHAREGISAAGAADALALRIANRLVGNRDRAAGLEMTLLGGSFRFEAAALFALAGAEMEATLDGRPVPAWAACDAGPGQLLVCGAARAAARTYLSVRGGIAVEPFLGSRSSHVPSRLGGLEGRPLRKNDRLPIGGGDRSDRSDRGDEARVAPAAARRLDGGLSIGPPGMAPWGAAAPAGPVLLRITEGAHAGSFAAAARRRFFESIYQVSPASDRMGLRLRGSAIESPRGGEILSEGMPLGAIQIPAGGEPMILFVDHQTTGGYPVIGCVASADLSHLAQLRPNDMVRFEPISIGAARAACLEQERWLESLLPSFG